MPSNRAILHDIAEFNLDPQIAHVETSANGRLRITRSTSPLGETVSMSLDEPVEFIQPSVIETTTDEKLETLMNAESLNVEHVKSTFDEVVPEKATKKQRNKKNESTTE